MRKLLAMTIAFLCASTGSLCAQSMEQDTLETWYAQFSQLRNLTLSPNGKWVAFKKWYNSGTNSDSAVVKRTDMNFSTIQFTCSGSPLFTKNTVYGQSINGSFNFVNLTTGKKYAFNEVKMAIGLSSLERFALLDQKRTIRLYSGIGKKLFSLQDIEPTLISDRKRNLFVMKKGNNNEIYDLSGNQPKLIYSSRNKINKLLLTPAAKHLFILEQDPLGNIMIQVFDIQKRILSKVILAVQKKSSNFLITEINMGAGYLIESTFSEKVKESDIVDIWYGNESDLQNRNRKTSKEFWLWKSGQQNLIQLPNNKFPQISSLNSNRYFFAYHPNKGHNYIHLLPQFQLNIYDNLLNTYHTLGNVKSMYFGSPKVYCSPDSSSVLASEDGERWTFFNIENNSKKLIDKEALNNPTFSTDGKYIIFEGTYDLWKYDIHASKLTPMNISTGLSPVIVNTQERKTQELSYFYLRTVDLTKPLIVELKNNENLTISYLLTKEGKQPTPLFSTPNKINGDIVYDQKYRSFYTLEENHNFPSTLFRYCKKSKEMLYKAKTIDEENLRLKKEIIRYSNSEGKKLKGVLYYPTNFDSSKKYPLITHIYQIQSDNANEYLLPDFTMSGFNIHTLLARGYFVFLPDIVFGKSGTGISALDCINKAIDAIVHNPNINFKKIGLIGRSHGGYETNFIATHSNRFTTYISGLGNSDIIRSYFSYNYNFKGPFYWQYENGQYEMEKPFAIDKERYLKNSPILNVERVNAPILLWTGKQDKNIAWDQVMEFYIGLRRNNKAVIALFYPEQGHGLNYGSKEIKDLSRRQLEWWDYFLKEKHDVPWINKQMNVQ